MRMWALILGFLHFATLSDGSTIENPRYYRKAEKQLAKRQQVALSQETWALIGATKQENWWRKPIARYATSAVISCTNSQGSW